MSSIALSIPLARAFLFAPRVGKRPALALRRSPLPSGKLTSCPSLLLMTPNIGFVMPVHISVCCIVSPLTSLSNTNIDETTPLSVTFIVSQCGELTTRCHGYIISDKAMKVRMLHCQLK